MTADYCDKTLKAYIILFSNDKITIKFVELIMLKNNFSKFSISRQNHSAPKNLFDACYLT